MDKKLCKKCGIEKDICEFDKKLSNKDGLSNRCKSCRRDYYNEYNKKNIDKKRKSYKEYYKLNRDKELLRSKNKHEKYSEQEKEYRKNNRDRISKREKERYHKDLVFKLKTNVRNRLKLFLKTKKIYKNNTTFEIVGGTPEIIKEHIEKQFIDGMTWDNYGFSGWHIDHIIPLSSAKTEEEVYKLCHYTNLQPLWANENYKKSNKII
jgi:hypothetical protein